MKRYLLSAVLLLGVFCLGIQAHAQTRYYVDSSATGLNNGSSWTDAYTDLQSALGAVVSGDTIWVARGTYFPGPSGTRTATFSMVSGVPLFGGFSGVTGAQETQLNQRNFIANGIK